MINSLRLSHVLFFAVFFYLILVLSRLPLISSFWVDEAVSVWIIGADSISALIARVREFQGQPSFYFLLLFVLSKSFAAIDSQEFLLRLPSVLAGIATVALLYRYFRRYVFASLALAGATLFLASDQILLSFISARPYGMALLFFAVGFFLLYFSTLPLAYARWLGLISLILSVYLQPTFLPGVVLVILFSGRFVVRSLIFFIVLVLPLLLSVSQKSSVHEYWTVALSLDAAAFVQIGLPFPLTLVLGTSILASVIFITPQWMLVQKRMRKAWRQDSIRRLWLLAASCLLAIFVYALVDSLTGVTVFRARYLLWAHFLLIFGFLHFLGCTLTPRFLSLVMLIAIGLLTIRELDRTWNVENWRAAVRVVSLDTPQDKQVFVESPLVESQTWPASLTAVQLDYLLAPVLAYNIDNIDFGVVRSVESQWSMGTRSSDGTVVTTPLSYFLANNGLERGFTLIGAGGSRSRYLLSTIFSQGRQGLEKSARAEICVRNLMHGSLHTLDLSSAETIEPKGVFAYRFGSCEDMDENGLRKE